MIFDNESDEAGRSRPPIAQDVIEFEQAVRQSVSSGQLLTAIEVARDGLKRFGSTPKLQQQLAVALAQTGALDGAREVLGELMKEAAGDVETLSLQGRVNKELWRRAATPEQGAEALRQAVKFYGEAFALKESYYPGINLAFALAASGQLAEAEEVARKVEKICRAEIARADGPPDGWLLATLAEALTHQGATSEAAKYYRQSAEVFKGRWRDLASMRKQAREVLAFDQQRQDAAKGRWFDLASLRRNVRGVLGGRAKGPEWLDTCFEFPSVVVFSGHMIDRNGRNPPRFAPEDEPAVREAIRAHLKKIKAAFGYSAAACGGDIIFCECLLELDAKVNLVLPCPVNTFKRQSVSFAGPEWERRFHNIVGNANTCLIANPAEYAASEADATSAMGLVYANRIITGLAALQAHALDLEVQAVALWDGEPSDAPGGTASVVSEWERRQLKPHVISPRPGAKPAAPAANGAANGATVTAAGIQHEIKPLLAAEVVNFSRINERQVPAFVTEFKGAIAKLMAGLPRAPRVAESWGGANYFLFDELEDAAQFALALRDTVAQTPWGERGLPAELGVRIVLHAGPLFAVSDPVLGRTSCLGSHVTRATRVQPITPTGQVYVTQEFAALCGAENIQSVSLEFLGTLRTAKLFEDAPLYRLDRKRKDAE